MWVIKDKFSNFLKVINNDNGVSEWTADINFATTFPTEEEAEGYKNKRICSASLSVVPRHENKSNLWVIKRVRDGLFLMDIIGGDNVYGKLSLAIQYATEDIGIRCMNRMRQTDELQVVPASEVRQQWVIQHVDSGTFFFGIEAKKPQYGEIDSALTFASEGTAIKRMNSIKDPELLQVILKPVDKIIAEALLSTDEVMPVRTIKAGAHKEVYNVLGDYRCLDCDSQWVIGDVPPAVCKAMLAVCKLCGRELNNLDDPYSTDCGGDCLKCMADAGDPDAMNRVAAIEHDEVMLESGYFPKGKHIKVWKENDKYHCAICHSSWTLHDAPLSCISDEVMPEKGFLIKHRDLPKYYLLGDELDDLVDPASAWVDREDATTFMGSDQALAISGKMPGSSVVSEEYLDHQNGGEKSFADECAEAYDTARPISDIDPGNHYRYTYKGIKLDPYRICQIVGMNGGPREHMTKKLLRGTDKDHTEMELVEELQCCLDRWREMLVEDAE